MIRGPSGIAPGQVSPDSDDPRSRKHSPGTRAITNRGGGTKGPHYDLHSGRLEPKGKVSLRQFFDQLQCWAPGIEQWIQLEGPALFPIEKRGNAQWPLLI